MTAHESPRVLRLDAGVSTLRGARDAALQGSRSRHSVTLEAYANQWLSELTGRRPRTVEKYTTSLVLHVLPRLGAKRLEDIGPDDIVALAKELRESGYSAWTVETTLTPLKTLFRHAVRRDVLVGSPFHKLERSELPSPWTTDERVLSTAEIARLLAACPPRYRTLIATAIFTGLRQSELLALRWEHIDPDAGIVRVRTALDRNRRHVPLKNASRAPRCDPRRVPRGGSRSDTRSDPLLERDRLRLPIVSGNSADLEELLATRTGAGSRKGIGGATPVA
jgi:integrase